MNTKAGQKRAVRYGFIAFNVIVLVVVAAFVFYKPDSADLGTNSVLKSSTVPASDDSNPLDQVSSADIALAVATMSSLPESTAINNQAAIRN